jgi:predicted rRNA methylase YqxC with S4 and FtsJ domains
MLLRFRRAACSLPSQLAHLPLRLMSVRLMRLSHAQVEEGGIVTDAAVHQEVISRITVGVEALGFRSHGIFESPVRGAIGKNVEFFIHASRTPSQG